MQRFGSVSISVAGWSGVTGGGALISTSSLDGHDAPRAEHGQHADDLTVQLFPSGRGGFRADYTTGRGSSSSKRAPPGNDILLSLRGGDGADGGIGGDGKNGYKGSKGSNASRYRDATPGGNGGRGGNGGHGSDGGNGGNGGSLEVLVDEQYMHLIFAIDWDVAGGQGGKAGRHGNPGCGGRGGPGGKPYSWKEHTGYEHECSGDCTLSSDTSTALTTSTNNNQQALSSLQGGRDIYFAFPQGVLSDGNNVVEVNNLVGRIPASIAPQFQQALLGASNTSNQLIRHTGEAGHASGCRQVKTYTSRYRAGASSGRDGPDGRAPGRRSPRPGWNGRPGNAVIFVCNEDGTKSHPYREKFQFQLVDFQVVDENKDGIFEPGECVIIRNIRIKNNASRGAMPTPRRTRIPLRMRSCPWLTPRNTLELPLGIEPGETANVQGEIWADIDATSVRDELETPLRAKATIQLDAVFPDLERPVPNFRYSRDIDIRYPLELVDEGYRFLDSIMPGTFTSVQWEVHNISRKDLGRNSRSRRDVVTSVQFLFPVPAAFGMALDEPDNPGSNSSTKNLDVSEHSDSICLSENLHVREDAAGRPTLDIIIKLSLMPYSSRGRERPQNLELIQQHEFSIAVSEPWRKSRNAQYLLLTSKNTSQESILAYTRFIREHLRMSADVFDVSLYGGLRAEGLRKQVLFEYSGKTVLALDEDLFQYSDRGTRGILDFVDPQEALALSFQGTAVASLQRKQETRSGRERCSIQHIAKAAAFGSSSTSGSEMTFPSTDELIRHLRSSRSDRRVDQFFIPCSSSNLRGRGTRLAHQLRKEFPLDRFIVTDNLQSEGLHIVHCHTQGETFSTAEVARVSNNVGQLMGFCGLNPAEAYTCVVFLPLKTRLDILHETHHRAREGVCRYSAFAQNAAKRSILIEMHQQVQAMASQPKWSDAAFSFKPEKHTTHSLFENANDKIMTVLEHDIMLPPAGMTGDLQLSPIAIELLSSVIQSARCQNFEQLMMKWFSPLRRTRSHVRKYLMGEIRKRIAPDTITDDDKDSKELLSKFKSFKRSKSVRQSIVNLNYDKNLNASIRQLTKGAISNIRSSYNSVENELPKSTYVPAMKLASSKAVYEEAARRRRSDEQHYRQLKSELGMSCPQPAISSRLDRSRHTSDASSIERIPATCEARTRELGASPVPVRTELKEVNDTFNELTVEASRNTSPRRIQSNNPWFGELLTLQEEPVGGSQDVLPEVALSSHVGSASLPSEIGSMSLRAGPRERPHELSASRGVQELDTSHYQQRAEMPSHEPAACEMDAVTSGSGSQTGALIQQLSDLFTAMLTTWQSQQGHSAVHQDIASEEVD